jgi:hypothetical protein
MGHALRQRQHPPPPQRRFINVMAIVINRFASFPIYFTFSRQCADSIVQTAIPIFFFTFPTPLIATPIAPLTFASTSDNFRKHFR